MTGDEGSLTPLPEYAAGAVMLCDLGGLEPVPLPSENGPLGPAEGSEAFKAVSALVADLVDFFGLQLVGVELIEGWDTALDAEAGRLAVVSERVLELHRFGFADDDLVVPLLLAGRDAPRVAVAAVMLAPQLGLRVSGWFPADGSLWVIPA